MDLIENCRKRNSWKNNQKIQSKNDQYDKLVDFKPSLLSNVERFKKTCIIIDELAVENEHSEIEWSSHKF